MSDSISGRRVPLYVQIEQKGRFLAVAAVIGLFLFDLFVAQISVPVVGAVLLALTGLVWRASKRATRRQLGLATSGRLSDRLTCFAAFLEGRADDKERGAEEVTLYEKRLLLGELNDLKRVLSLRKRSELAKIDLGSSSSEELRHAASSSRAYAESIRGNSPYILSSSQLVKAIAAILFFGAIATVLLMRHYHNAALYNAMLKRGTVVAGTIVDESHHEKELQFNHRHEAGWFREVKYSLDDGEHTTKDRFPHGSREEIGSAVNVVYVPEAKDRGLIQEDVASLAYDSREAPFYFGWGFAAFTALCAVIVWRMQVGRD